MGSTANQTVRRCFHRRVKDPKRILLGLNLAALLVMALSMSACANVDVKVMAGSAILGSTQDFVVNVGDCVFFANDQVDLSPQAITTLETQVQWLQAYPRYTVTIEGHAHESGTREYNIALGARRAQDVRNFLLSPGIVRAA